MHDDDDFPEHIHDAQFEPGTVLEEIEGLEMFTLRSVGIDIGSSTSHLVFSQLTLRREGAALSSQFKVTDRQILYRSGILLTPYLSGTLMDTDRISEFIHAAYREAGFTSDAIDTGAVVITGEALKKENAKPIAELFAQESGKFICATAGPNHEALLAAYGCGAVALSKAHHATVMNIDVGGGTSKLSVIRDGVVARTAAVSVGARLIAFDGNGVVTRVEEPAKPIMKELGHTVAIGKPVTEAEREEFAGLMAKLLFEVVEGGPLSPLAKGLLITESLEGYSSPQEFDYVVFSGGVSEYVYGYDQTPYGDVGPYFGEHIRRRAATVFKQGALQEPTEGIRATVIGAGEYTIQASGNTSHLSGVQALPAFGLKVVRPFLDGQDSVKEAVQNALAKFDLPCFTSGLALALSINTDQPDYPLLRKIAEGISAVVSESDTPTAPLFIVLDMDVAKSLGAILKEELRVEREVVVVDGIDVGDLDFLDIGRPMGVSEVLPVTVKSLMFPSSA